MHYALFAIINVSVALWLSPTPLDWFGDVTFKFASTFPLLKLKSDNLSKPRIPLKGIDCDVFVLFISLPHMEYRDNTPQTVCA